MTRWIPAAALSLAAALTAAGGAQAATNLVQNGGFEQADPSPWVAANWVLTEGRTHSGERAMSTGCVGANCVDPDAEGAASLSQVIGGLTVGQVYTLSFFFTPSSGESGTTTPNALRVFWGDDLVTDLMNVPDVGYGLYSFDITATAAAQTLHFLGRNDPANQFLDDVSLVAREAASAAPEPASWALMLLGFGGMGAALRRRRMAAA